MRRLAGEYNGLCYKNKSSSTYTIILIFDINNYTSLNKILLLLDLI